MVPCSVSGFWPPAAQDRWQWRSFEGRNRQIGPAPADFQQWWSGSTASQHGVQRIAGQRIGFNLDGLVARRSWICCLIMTLPRGGTSPPAVLTDHSMAASSLLDPHFRLRSAAAFSLGNERHEYRPVAEPLHWRGFATGRLCVPCFLDRRHPHGVEPMSADSQLTVHSQLSCG